MHIIIRQHTLLNANIRRIQVYCIQYACVSLWFIWKAEKRQGQSDLYSYCGDERSFHFVCLDNGDFSLLGSISLFSDYQGNYTASFCITACENRGCYRSSGRTKKVRQRGDSHFFRTIIWC